MRRVSVSVCVIASFHDDVLIDGCKFGDLGRMGLGSMEGYGLGRSEGAVGSSGGGEDANRSAGAVALSTARAEAASCECGRMVWFQSRDWPLSTGKCGPELRVFEPLRHPFVPTPSSPLFTFCSFLWSTCLQ